MLLPCFRKLLSKLIPLFTFLKKLLLFSPNFNLASPTDWISYCAAKSFEDLQSSSRTIIYKLKDSKRSKTSSYTNTRGIKYLSNMVQNNIFHSKFRKFGVFNTTIYDMYPSEINYEDLIDFSNLWYGIPFKWGSFHIF